MVKKALKNMYKVIFSNYWKGSDFLCHLSFKEPGLQVKIVDEIERQKLDEVHGR